MAIRVEEWLQELEKLSKRVDSGHTADELAEKMGKSQRVVREWLRKAHKLGWLKVGRRTQRAIDGKNCIVPVYSIVKPTKAGRG